jgi:glycosyltransferase involved in cell wall biosynthesis
LEKENVKKLKIAVYHNLSAGGAKNAIEDVIAGLSQKGHLLDIYSGEKFYLIKVEKNYFGKINNFLLPINLFRYKNFSKNLAKRINEKNYDLAIITNSQILQHPYILRYLRIPKLLISQEPLRIAYERGLHVEKVYKRYYQGLIRKFFLIYSFAGGFLKKGPDRENLKKADKLIVNSYFSKENFLSAYGVLGKVVYPRVDTEKFKPAKEKKPKYILSVGAYQPLKAHDLTIKSLKYIPREKRPVLKILGFGVSGSSQKREFEYLKRLRDKLKLKNWVEFENGFKGKNIVEYYQNAYCTVCPNFLEPFGLVAIESMACEVPVVAIKEGGFRETVLDGKTGFLVERDPRQIAQKIEYLLNHLKEREEMGKMGREWVKKSFSLERMIEEIENEIYSLIKNENRYQFNSI